MALLDSLATQAMACRANSLLPAGAISHLAAISRVKGMKPIQITIPGRPVPMGRPRTYISRRGHAQIYTPVKTEAWLKKAEGFVARCMNGRGPIEGPVRIVAKFYFSPPKSWSMKRIKDALEGKVQPTGKTSIGDLDNLLKSCMDTLSPLVIEDDAFVVEAAASKHYDTEERVEITVFPMGETG